MTQYSGKVIRKTPVTPTQQAASGVWKLNEQAAAIRNNNWPVPGVPNPISRSVRLRNSASAYFSRTYATSPTNNKINTFSGWVKRGTLGTLGYIFAAYDGTSALAAGIWFQNDKLWAEYGGPSGSGRITTTQVFRDPSAWYHIVLAIDTTQATASNRVKLYINGVQVTAFDTATNPTLNLATAFTYPNSNNRVGANWDNSGPFDGYLTEINFIDGQQLTPSSFGTTDPLTGVWEPIAYTGTYGTNGFYLNFKDNTSTTTLGYDYSGNSNNWNANNISLTSGSTYDSMLDVPTQWIGYSTTTDTSAVTRGNYCTWNPVGIYVTTPFDGNLAISGTSAGANGTIGAFSGKYYWECVYTAIGSGEGVLVGIRSTDSIGTGAAENVGYYGGGTENGRKVVNGVGSAYAATWTTGDVIGVALDLDGGTVTFYKNNSSQGAISFTVGGKAWTAFNWRTGAAGTNSATINFGQRPFTYTPPSGFKSLNTTNLPDSTIVQGNQWMDVNLWTGNNSTNVITNSGSMQPDFLWIKSRSSAFDNELYDSVRGVTKYLASNTTAAEATETAGSGVTSFNSNGFTLGPAGGAYVNNNALTFVGWQWKANGTPAVTNTAGSITSTVSASTTSGFSVATYTGTGANATVGHGLGVAPKMVIVKCRNNAEDWAVYHANLTSAAYVVLLNSTAGQANSPTNFNSTAPTSSVFSVGTAGNTNGNTQTYVAYSFAEVAGFSKFGSYTGNGSTDGPFIFTGFRPAFVMCKRTDGVSNWNMADNRRPAYNAADEMLLANSSSSALTSYPVDLLSNGFKLRTTEGGYNASGSYIYAAFAENPFKNSLAR